jgi:hypothetical protein
MTLLIKPAITDYAVKLLKEKMGESLSKELLEGAKIIYTHFLQLTKEDRRLGFLIIERSESKKENGRGFPFALYQINIENSSFWLAANYTNRTRKQIIDSAFKSFYDRG